MSTLPRDPEALLRRLDWTVIRRLDGLLHGDYRTLFRGTGLDLADLREYQFQDDVRHIDWNVTARLNTPYVREYLEDREVAAWFIVDRSGSLGFGSGALSKRDLAVNFVSVVAKLLSRHGNAVGLYGHDALCFRSCTPCKARPHRRPRAARPTWGRSCMRLRAASSGAHWFLSYPISSAPRAGQPCWHVWPSAMR
jgi:uncharacterized protein (DUF58 family)